MNKILLLLIISVTLNAQHGSNIDIDALNYCKIAGITLNNQKKAYHYLYSSLKNQRLWSRFPKGNSAIYVIFNGFDTWKYNLIDPRDADDAFRLIPSTSFIANADMNGIEVRPVGAVYINTSIIPATHLTNNNTHAAVWKNNVAADNYQPFGVSNGANFMELIIDFGGTTDYYRMNGATGANQISATSPDSIGLYLMSRTAINDFRAYFNGHEKTSTTSNGTNSLPATYPIYLFCRNASGTPGLVCSTSWISYYSFGLGMTPTEAATYTTIVNTFIGMLQNQYTIINNGTYTPPLSDHPRLTQWDTLKVGALICFNEQSFDGDPTTITDAFNISNVNSSAWVDSLQGKVRYIGLTIKVEQGFWLIDNPVEYPNILKTFKQVGIQYSRVYDKYDVTLTNSDPLIVNKFVDKCNELDIVPVGFINVTDDYNQKGSIAGQYAGKYRDAYNRYVAAMLQFIMKRYGFKYLWLDSYNGENRLDFQLYYNSMKAIDTNSVMIVNTVCDLTFNKYPYDIGSNEEDFKPGLQTWDTTLAKHRLHSGTVYYIPEELVTRHKTGSPVNWTAYYYWTPDPAYTVRSVSNVQTILDSAIVNNSNFFLSIDPDTLGIIHQDRIDLFNNLNW